MQGQQESKSTPFRLDVQLHELLTRPVSAPTRLESGNAPQTFPDPAFPQHPELLGPVDMEDEWMPPERRNWTAGQVYHAMQGWLFPYIQIGRASCRERV